MLVCFLLGCSGCKKGPDSHPDTPEVAVEANSDILNLYAIRENDLNPLRISSESGRLMISLVFRPLISVGQNFDYTCCLAETVSFSDSCKTVKIRLNPDITWDDGSPLTVSDVDYTIHKIIEYGEEYPYFENLSNVVDFYADGSEFVFHLASPDSGFPCLLNFPIVKKGSLGGGSVSLTGTGDYKITEHKEFSSITLTAKKPGGKGFADVIKFTLLPNSQAAVSSFRLGNIDAIKISAGNAPSYTLDKDSTYSTANANNYSFLSVNLSHKHLSDVALRKIIAQIASSETVITDLVPGFAASTGSPVHPMAYYALPLEYTYADIKEALDSIGYVPDESGIRTKTIDDEPSNLSFSILVNSDNPSRVIAAEYLANLMNSFGMQVAVTKTNFESYTQALSEGNFDLALCETKISLNNDYSFLLGTDGSANFGGYSSEAADTLLSAIALAADKNERAEHFRKLQEQFATVMPHIPLWFTNQLLLYNNKKLEISSIGGIGDEFAATHSWTVK